MHLALALIVTIGLLALIAIAIKRMYDYRKVCRKCRIIGSRETPNQI